MSHYCGIDLHSNNHVLVIIDKEDKRVFDKRLDNNLLLTLKALAPYRESLQGIAWSPRLIGIGWLMACKNKGTTCNWSIQLRSSNMTV